MTQTVDLRLNSDEALVLFELLSRWSQGEGIAKPAAECFESSAEIGALVRLLAHLESQLTEPFQADYLTLLDAARERIALETGHPEL